MAATFPLLPLLLVFLPPSARAAPDAVVSRIAFGSCANQSAPQPIWDAVVGFDPQVFVWLGDNVYGDNKRPFRVFGRDRTVGPWKNVPRFYPSTEEELRRRYQLARAQPGYARLRDTAQVIGTWDDHDYGLNDAGKEFSGKVFTQRLLLDFLDEAQDSKRRKQAGVYTSYMFGPEGKRVKVILLDTRYHRDPLLSDGTILGDPQWQWLERELHGPQSEVTIIGSSIQVVSNLSATTGPLFYVESWARFPRERERLFRLIDSSKRAGVIFISGDVHFGEITRFDCGTQYPLYDVTSSGLTQSVENSVPAVFQPLMRLLAVLTPTTMRVFSPNCMYKSCTTGQPNFGVIAIDWNAVPPRVKLELRDVEGHSVHSVEFPVSELQPSDAHAIKRQAHTFQRHCTLETELPWITPGASQPTATVARTAAPPSKLGRRQAAEDEGGHMLKISSSILLKLRLCSLLGAELVPARFAAGVLSFGARKEEVVGGGPWWQPDAGRPYFRQIWRMRASPLALAEL